MDWKSILSTVAPGLATALGGPLAGVAVRTLSQVLLGTADGSPEAVEKAVLAADPAMLAQIKQAELQFQKDMKALEIDLARIDAADRDSARRREVDTRSYAPAVLATVVVIGFFGILWALVSGKAIMPKEYELLVGGLIGTLGSAVIQVFNYYFGSSAGSAAKQATLDRMTPTK